jgi:hypothetical protein
MDIVRLYVEGQMKFFFKGATLYILRQESISRPIAPVSQVAGGDDTDRPRRQGYVSDLAKPYIMTINLSVNLSLNVK